MASTVFPLAKERSAAMTDAAVFAENAGNTGSATTTAPASPTRKGGAGERTTATTTSPKPPGPKGSTPPASRSRAGAAWKAERAGNELFSPQMQKVWPHRDRTPDIKGVGFAVSTPGYGVAMVVGNQAWHEGRRASGENRACRSRWGAIASMRVASALQIASRS